MLVVHGVYRWARRIVGFRNDHCLTCNDTRVAVQLRAFRCFSLYWIPVLPLGIWNSWHCTVCGEDPHARTQTSGGVLRWAAVVLLAIFAFVAWSDPVDPDAQGVTWSLRILLPICTVAAVRWAVVRPREPTLTERLAVLPRYAGTTCPACGGELVRGSTTVCGQCEAVQQDHHAPA